MSLLLLPNEIIDHIISLTDEYRFIEPFNKYLRKKTILKLSENIDSETIIQEDNLQLLQILYNSGFKFDDKPMKLASVYGYLDIVKFFHSIGCKSTSFAIDWACFNGHLDVVEYLHSIGYKPTSDAMEFASRNGHLEIVKFLHKIDVKYKKKYHENILNSATKKGHLEVVKFLYPISDYPSTNIMDSAILNYHLEIVKFLYSNGAKYTNFALRKHISKNTDSEIVKFLNQ